MSRVASWSSPAEWPDAELRNLHEELERYDLYKNVAELEIYGFTVVDASKTGATGAAKRAFEAAVNLVERRSGQRPDVEKGSTHGDTALPVAFHFVHEDPAFQELMVNPVAVALTRYLLGRRCMLSESTIFMKGPQTVKYSGSISGSSEIMQLGMHCDYILRPEPFPSYAEECNTTFMLTDYTIENGAIAVVPGSHKHRRRPKPGEAEDQLVGIEAPQGSIIILNDATWHGSLPSVTPGLRVGMAMRYSRPHIWRRERFDDLPEGFLEGKSQTFRELMGEYEFHVVDHGPIDRAQLRKHGAYPSVYS